MLAINDAGLHLPWATALFSLDHRWVQNRKQQVENFPGMVYCAVSEDFELNRGPQNAVFLKRLRSRSGFSTDPRYIHVGGGHSGYGALNVALLKGARRIVLLGYDFTNANENWHSGYPWSSPVTNSKMYQKWAQILDNEAGELAKQGETILNASENGLLRNFPKVSLGELPLEAA